MPSSVKAVRCRRFAGLDADGRPAADPAPLRDVLALEDVPAPACEPGHVLVRTAFAGVQYPDALQAQGFYQHRPELPYVPGMDAAGFVEEAGAGVGHVRPGDRVVAQMSLGALAEVVKAPASNVWPAPAGVDLARCANLGRNFFPAWHSLKVLGEVGPDSLVLVDGASGGVGMAAVELARALGARVIAGVSGPEKRDGPAAAGADRVLCYGRGREGYRRFRDEVRRASAELGRPQGVDLVLDVVQGELFEAALLSVIRPLGKICLVGFTAGQRPIRPGLILIKEAVVVGSIWAGWAAAHPEAHQRNVAQILGLLASGAVRPRADRIFPLADYAQAFELFEHNRGRGNTVVRFTDE